MTTSKVNWAARVNHETVLELQDFLLRFVLELEFNSPNMPFRGKRGYQLVYRPTGHVMAEGVDPVASVAQTYREQRILDRVKSDTKLLSEDPQAQQLASFLADAETEGRAAN